MAAVKARTAGAAGVAPSPGEERVDAILRAACRVIVRDGAHGLRMATVADEAGVSKALVHYYFATRHDLLRRAFAHADTALTAAVADDIAGLRTGRAKAAHTLAAGLAAGPPYDEQRSLWNEVWSGLRYDQSLRPLVADCYRAWLDRLTALVEEGRADGSIAAGVDARAAATRLAAAADGLDSMLYLGLVDHEEARARVLEALDRELAGPVS